MSLKPPENDQTSNPRSFSFQSKTSHKEEDHNSEFLEQFEEALAERDQRIESLELELETRQNKFIEQMREYEVKLLKFQNEIKPGLEEKPEIIKEMESHNRKLEELLLSCEKLDLKGLVSIEKQITQEDFYGIEALKRGFEDRLARVSQENKRTSIDLSERLRKLTGEKEVLDRELRKTKEREAMLNRENGDLKQKIMDLNNKIFELNVNLRNVKEKSEFSKSISENLSKTLLESLNSKFEANNQEPVEGLADKVAEKILSSQQESGMLKEYVVKIETYAKNEKKLEKELEKLQSKINGMEEAIQSVERDRDSEIEENRVLKLKLEEMKNREENYDDFTVGPTEVEQLREKLAVAEERIRAQSKETKEITEKLSFSEEIIKGKAKIIEDLKDKIKGNLNNITELTEKLSKVQINKSSDISQEDKASFEKLLQEKDEEIHELEDKLHGNEEILKSLTNKNRLLEEKPKKVANLEEKIRDLTNKLKSSEAQSQEYYGKAVLYDEVIEKVSNNQELISELTEKLKTAEIKANSFEEELARNKREINKKDSSLKMDENIVKIRELEEGNIRNREEIMGYQGQVTKLKVEMEENQRKMKIENDDIQRKLQGQIVKLKIEIEEQQKKLRQKEEEFKEEKEEILTSKQGRYTEEKIQELETVISQLSAQKSRLEIEKSSIIETNQTLSRNFEKNSEKIGVLEEKLRSLGEENIRLTKVVDVKELNLQNILKENKRLKAFEDKGIESQTEIEASKESLNKQNTLIISLQQNLEAKEKEASQLSASIKQGFETKNLELNQIINSLRQNMEIKEREIRQLSEKNRENFKVIEAKEHEIQETLEKNHEMYAKLEMIAKVLQEKQLEISELKRRVQEFEGYFTANFRKIISYFSGMVRMELDRFFIEVQQKNEEKMLIVQRIYDKKEASYRGNYETQISRLEKDLEGITKSFKEESSYLNEKPQKLPKPQMTPYLLNPVGPASMSNPNNDNNRSQAPNKTEFINYLAKKSVMKPKIMEKGSLFNSQVGGDSGNPQKTYGNLSLTPKSQQSNSFYLANTYSTNPGNPTPILYDSGSKRNFSEIYPPRGSWESTQKEVSDLKKSLNLLHDEHQKLLEVVETKEKTTKSGLNDQFAVKCFEKLFDQLAVSLERESQLRMMAQIIDEKVSKGQNESNNIEEIMRRLEEKEQMIRALEQENAQYKSLCKELQIQLDFKRAQMKFLTQNNEGHGNNNGSYQGNNNAINNSGGGFRKFVEVKRDYSLTHHHSRNIEENETIPNVSITYQRPNFQPQPLKSPKTPTRLWGNMNLRGTKEKMDGSAKKTEKGKNSGKNPKWV